jgi:protein phosphatase
LPDFLEYPTEAFDYYKTRGVGKVICEEKHMGSRAVIVLCKDTETAARRFKVSDGSFGIIYTRTGRRFFDDKEHENSILTRLNNVLEKSGFFNDFSTDWVCLDAELMPWSAKAQKLLEEQYALVGRAGRSGLKEAVAAIDRASAVLGDKVMDTEAQSSQNVDLSMLLQQYQSRAEALELYTDAYRRYCWDIKSIDDYRIAPFHILATEGKSWFDENHVQHMETIAKYMIGSDKIFMVSSYLLVDLLDENSVAESPIHGSITRYFIKTHRTSQCPICVYCLYRLPFLVILTTIITGIAVVLCGAAFSQSQHKSSTPQTSCK